MVFNTKKIMKKIFTPNFIILDLLGRIIFIFIF